MSVRPGRPRIRLGIIGAGSHCSENLLPAAAVSGDFHLGHICTRSLVGALLAKERWGAAGATTSIGEVFDTSDAVLVCGPPELHEQVIGEATGRGIPLFVEKPPARTSELLDRASAVPLPAARVMVDFNFRFAAAVTATGAVFAGDDLRVMKVRMISRRPMQPLWDRTTVVESFMLAVGIHAIDLVTSRFGVPHEVYASFAQLDPSRFTATVCLRFADGRLATLELGNYSNTFESSVEFVAGGRSSIVENLTAVVSRRHDEQSVPMKQATSVELGGLSGGYERNGYGPALTAFAGAVRDEAPWVPGLNAAKQALDVIATIIRQLPEGPAHG